MERMQGCFAAVAIAWLLFSSAAGAQGSAPSKKPEKIEPVAVVGCLREAKPGVWTLVNASEPVPSHANAPSAKELAALPKGGGRSFQLVGLAAFDMPSHRGHTVVVKGLRIAATPADRLNVTSITTVVPACATAPGFY
jgi:hypothetical protein